MLCSVLSRFVQVIEIQKNGSVELMFGVGELMDVCKVKYIPVFDTPQVVNCFKIESDVASLPS